MNTISSDITACINHVTREVNLIKNSKKKMVQKNLPSWSRTVATSKNRISFWYKVWLACRKPRIDHACQYYKLAKPAYRQAHRLAFNKHVNSSFSTQIIEVNNIRVLRKIVDRAKNTKHDQSEDISLSQLSLLDFMRIDVQNQKLKIRCLNMQEIKLI